MHIQPHNHTQYITVTLYSSQFASFCNPYLFFFCLCVLFHSLIVFVVSSMLFEIKSEVHFGFWNVTIPVLGCASSVRDGIFVNDRREGNLVTSVLIKALGAFCCVCFCIPSSLDSLSCFKAFSDSISAFL